VCLYVYVVVMQFEVPWIARCLLERAPCRKRSASYAMKSPIPRGDSGGDSGGGGGGGGGSGGGADSIAPNLLNDFTGIRLRMEASARMSKPSSPSVAVARSPVGSDGRGIARGNSGAGSLASPQMGGGTDACFKKPKGKRR
jgi:hypothetical protein